MGEKDIVEKHLLDYGDVFADIVNVLLFNGEEVVKPDEITATTLRSMYKADNSKLHEMERDVAKYWTRGGVKLALYGLENQTMQEEYMPLRILGYDGQNYRSQLISEKAGTGEVLPVEPYPVVTLVLYFGSTPWTKPKTICECFEVPENLKPFVNDFKINLFEIAYLTKEQVDMFKSDFKIVAEYFVQMRTNKKYVPSKQEIEHVDELLKFMSVFTGDSRYETVQLEAKGGTVTMCGFLEAAIQEGIAQGIKRGVEQEIFKSVYEQDYSLARGAQKLGCTEEEFLRRYLEAGYVVPSEV